jgi:Ribbon-helix-helix protein, copG family
VTATPWPRGWPSLSPASTPDMPDKRAADVTLRNIGFKDELWERIKAKAAREGISASEAIRRLARDWVEQ